MKILQANDLQRINGGIDTGEIKTISASTIAGAALGTFAGVQMFKKYTKPNHNSFGMDGLFTIASGGIGAAVGGTLGLVASTLTLLYKS